jgi:uncharacterized protein
MIARRIEKDIINSLKNNPVAAILGPRQCGKTTLAKKIIKDYPSAIYLDLERPSDLNKLDNAEWYFEHNKHGLICIDEIQRKPELFALLRSIVDETGNNAQFLILGSASRALIKQSSESLAGRISYHTLSPFLWSEAETSVTMEDYIARGGFPRSMLASNDTDSFSWREDFVTTFLERDILQWTGASATTMRRLWQMLAYNSGQPVNFSSLGNALGVSNVTIKNYIELLAGTFMIDIVKPWFNNINKRVVKAPKIYINDTGIAAALLGLDSFDRMTGHSSFGALWETMILSNIKAYFPKAEICYYRTAQGAELDFIVYYKGKTVAIECKTSAAPDLTRGNYQSIKDISPERTFIVSPVKESWEKANNIIVASLPEMLLLMESAF